MGTRHQQTLRAVHHILAPVFLSEMYGKMYGGWISHWNFFVIAGGNFTNLGLQKCWTQIFPVERSVLVFAQWQQSLETTLVSLAGTTL